MAIGRHLIADFYLCEAVFLDDADRLEQEMTMAVRSVGADIGHAFFHGYARQGVCGFVFFSQSHLTIHTRPEVGYAALDIFTWEQRTDPAILCELMVAALRPQVVATDCLSRGQHLVADAG